MFKWIRRWLRRKEPANLYDVVQEVTPVETPLQRRLPYWLQKPEQEFLSAREVRGRFGRGRSLADIHHDSERVRRGLEEQIPLGIEDPSRGD